MKKKMLKSACLCMALCMPLLMLSCSNEDKALGEQEPIAVNVGGGEVKGISVTLTDFETVGADTRLAYTDSDSGVKVTWAMGDTIGIFPNKGGQVEFPIEEGTQSNQATFDGGGWALKANSTYAAYYPYRNANGNYGNQRIQLKYSGQQQAANGSAAHLSAYDYQATGGVSTNAKGYLNFQFKHLGALLKLKLTVPKAGVYTSLTMTSSEKVFITKAELDISGDVPVLKPVSYSNSFTLKLKNIELTADNSELTAYMMLAPADLSKGSLELTIDGDRIFTATLTGHSVEAGKQYPIEKAFVDNTPSPDQVIAFADEAVKAICIANWDTNKDGELSYEEAAAVTDIGNKFYFKTKIKSFDEFQYFTGLTSVQENAFKSCLDLEKITLPSSLEATASNMFDGCAKLTSVIVSEGIRRINSYTFNNCPKLTEIILPSSLKGIDASAFEGTALTSIMMQEGLTYIGYRAFYNCNGLTSITIPNGVISIGASAFSGCSNLTSINMPDGVTTIGYSAFSDCVSLTGIAIPGSVTSIGSLAFYKCSKLTSIEIPGNVTSIGSSAFSGCSNLTSIVIPEGVTSIEGDTFKDCSNLTDIVIPMSVTSLNWNAFYGCISLESITLPETVISIGELKFSSFRALTSINIPVGVTTIGDYAFAGCSSLTNITIPDGVTSIGEYAFGECTNLTSIMIPESVKSIGEMAFHYCRNVTNIIVDEDNTYFDSRNDCNAIIESNSNKLIFGCGSTVIPVGVSSVGSHAFYGCENLTSIVIPEGVVSIDERAFGSCTNLRSINIPESLKTIGDGAFYGCNITSTSIPDGVTYIGEWAFQSCSSLTEFTIPKRVTSIGDGTFCDCSSLTNIIIPEGLKYIGYLAFGGCSSLTSIVIPEGVISIGDSAFGGCSSLTSIVIPEGVTSIGDYVFSGCVKLTSITCMAVNPPACQMIYGNDRYTGAIYVPATSVDAYKVAEGWKDYASRIQAIPQ